VVEDAVAVPVASDGADLAGRDGVRVEDFTFRVDLGKQGRLVGSPTG